MEVLVEVRDSPASCLSMRADTGGKADTFDVGGFDSVVKYAAFLDGTALRHGTTHQKYHITEQQSFVIEHCDDPSILITLTANPITPNIIITMRDTATFFVKSSGSVKDYLSDTPHTN